VAKKSIKKKVANQNPQQFKKKKSCSANKDCNSTDVCYHLSSMSVHFCRAKSSIVGYCTADTDCQTPKKCKLYQGQKEISTCQ